MIFARLILSMILCSFVFVPAVHAGNESIPGYLNNWHDELLAERDELLAIRGRTNTDLRECDERIRALESVLSGNVVMLGDVNRGRVAAKRDEYLSYRHRLEDDLHQVETGLTENSNDLAKIEKDMAQWATLRTMFH